MHFKGLTVWQKSIELTERIYKLTQHFPAEERFGLQSQMRRATVSIPSNIAEGHSRNSTGEFLQFIGIAKGSAAELETQLIISQRLGYVQEESLNPILEILDEVGKMLSGLQRSLKI